MREIHYHHYQPETNATLDPRNRVDVRTLPPGYATSRSYSSSQISARSDRDHYQHEGRHICSHLSFQPRPYESQTVPWSKHPANLLFRSHSYNAPPPNDTTFLTTSNTIFPIQKHCKQRLKVAPGHYTADHVAGTRGSSHFLPKRSFSATRFPYQIYTLNPYLDVEPAGKMSGLGLNAAYVNCLQSSTLLNAMPKPYVRHVDGVLMKPVGPWGGYLPDARSYMTPRTLLAQNTVSYLPLNPSGKLDHFSESTSKPNRDVLTMGLRK